MNQSDDDFSEEKSQEEDDNQFSEPQHQEVPKKKVNKSLQQLKILDRMNNNFECLKFTRKTDQQNIILDDLQFNGEVLEERSLVTMLQSSQAIKKNFSIETQLRLLRASETVQIHKNELIILQNELDDCSLFIIKRGSIELFLSYRNKQNQIIKRTSLSVLKNNQSFGDYSFFSGRAPMAGARALEDTELIKITRQNLLMCLNQYPLDQEKYFEINHQLLNNRFQSLELPCYNCGSRNHLALKCHRLIYVPDRQGVILRHLFSQPHSRINLQRRRRFILTTIFYEREINKSIQKIQVYDIEIEQGNQINENESIQLDIDKIRTFARYYSDYNIVGIVERYNKYMEKLRVDDTSD